MAEQLICERQEAHLRAVDSAYVESYNKLREAAGQDVTQPHLIADSYRQYFAFRHSLQHRKLLATVTEKQEHGSFPANNRFALPSCGGLDVPAERSAVTSATPSAPEQVCSYMAWRRSLLGLRFEQRRAATEQDMIRRLAAEAMQRAIAAESEARGEWAEMQTEAAAESEAGSDGGGQGLSADGAKVKAAASAVWRVAKRLDGGDRASDPAVAAAMITLGLIPADKDRGRGRGRGDGVTGPLQAHPGMAEKLFGYVAAATLASSTVTSIAFLAPVAGEGGMGIEGNESDIFALGTDTGRVYLCSASTGSVWSVLEGHEGAITGIDWARADGQVFLATASLDKTLRLWFVSIPMFAVPPPPPSGGSVGEDVDGEGQHGAGTRRSASVPHRLPRAGVEALTGASTRSASVKPSSARARAALNRSRDRASARAAMAAENEAAREQAMRDRGPVALGGSADCVQRIPTDYPLTHVGFSPLNPGLVVAAAIEESDYNDWIAVQEQVVGKAGEGARSGEEDGVAQLVQQGQGEAGAEEFHTESDVAQERAKSEAQAAEIVQVSEAAAEEAGEGAVEESPVNTSYRGFGTGGQEDESGKTRELTRKVSGMHVAALTMKAGRLFKKGLKKTMETMETAAQEALDAMSKPVALGGLEDALSLGMGGGGGTYGGGRGEASLPKAHPRGYIMVFDAVGGRLIQSRRVQASQVTGPTLSRPCSFVTAMAWADDGRVLYVADGRGAVHAYEAEADEAKMGSRPLKEHNVIFGEASITGGVLGLQKGVEGLNRLGELMMGNSEGVETAGPAFFASLFFRRDVALGVPVLVGLDTTCRARAVTLPMLGSLGMGALAMDLGAIDTGLDSLAVEGDEVGRKVLAGIGTTVKASMQAGVALAKTTVAVSTLGAVQVATVAQAKELDGFVQYSPLTAPAVQALPAPAFAGGLGLRGLVSSSLCTGVGMGSTSHAGLDAMFGRGPSHAYGNQGSSIGSHTVVAPFPAGDLLLGATAAGDVYVLAPHGLPHPVSRAGRGHDRHGMGRDGTPDVSHGSGVTAAQVVSRLQGHPAPIAALAASPDGRFIVSADTQGRTLIWSR